MFPSEVPHIVTVATSHGATEIKDRDVLIARLSQDDMEELIDRHSIHTVVDISHPYATEVSRQAQDACEEKGIRYLRYVREKVHEQNVIYLKSLEECLDFLSTLKGTVFFTTGSKNIRDFESVRGKNRFIYRILPAAFSLDECVKNDVALQDIIAMRGPISENLNIAMFREYHADFVVMKDSGDRGGTPEKLNACYELEITPIVWGRDSEDGESSLRSLLKKTISSE